MTSVFETQPNWWLCSYLNNYIYFIFICYCCEVNKKTHWNEYKKSKLKNNWKTKRKNFDACCEWNTCIFDVMRYNVIDVWTWITFWYDLILISIRLFGSSLHLAILLDKKATKHLLLTLHMSIETTWAHALRYAKIEKNSLRWRLDDASRFFFLTFHFYCN